MPSVPNGQDSQIMAWPPRSTGTRESRIPAARLSAPKTSHVPTAAETETIAIHVCRTVSRARA